MKKADVEHAEMNSGRTPGKEVGRHRYITITGSAGARTGFTDCLKPGVYHKDLLRVK